jgi:hypothetical protein
MHHKVGLRKLLFALGACPSGRARHAGKTLLKAWQTANAKDLYWLVSHLRECLYPGNYTEQMAVLDQLRMIAKQVYPGRSYEFAPAHAKLIRAWFAPSGELNKTVERWKRPN